MPEFKGSVVAVQTAPFWSDELAAIDKKHEKVGQMRDFLDAKHKDHANADGKMTEEQKREFVKKFEADLITPAETRSGNAAPPTPATTTSAREDLRADGQELRRGQPQDAGVRVTDGSWKPATYPSRPVRNWPAR